MQRTIYENWKHKSVAKDKHDVDTEDWVDADEERREREIQEHARRQLRKERGAEKHAGLRNTNERKGR